MPSTQARKPLIFGTIRGRNTTEFDFGFWRIPCSSEIGADQMKITLFKIPKIEPEITLK